MMRLLLPVLVACSGDKEDTGGDTQELTGPAMSHTAPTSSFHGGDNVSLSVDASDPEGVDGLVVYHRTEGATYWDVDAMAPTGSGGFSVTLKGMQEPGLEYYFKATDDGDPQAVAYLPIESSSAPYGLAVVPEGIALPFFEGFEPGETGEDSLIGLGWWSPSEASDGYTWRLATNHVASGSQSVLHPRSLEEVGEVRDWLVSPALDLTTAEGGVMVAWTELGVATQATQEHGLYISTGSRDPDDGDFVPVEVPLVEAEEGEWTGVAVDLSAWAEADVAYLAWRYSGTYADDWYVDDIEVRALAPFLSADLVWSPDPVHPGEIATLSFAVDNGANADADGLVATLILPEGGGAVEANDLVVDTVPAMGSGTVDFAVLLDVGLADNRYLPVVLDLTDGTDSWSFALQMTVGLPSTATVELELWEAGLVGLVVGVGDPDDPTWTTGTLSTSHGEAGTYLVDVDITDAFDALPPAAGAGRWFAQLDTLAAGEVSAFSIEADGVLVQSTDVPVLLDASGDTHTVYLPQPPAPRLSSVSPTSAAPGDSALALSFTVVNDGAGSSGAVSATLVSVDPDVTVVSGAEVVIDSGTWTTGEGHTLVGPVIDISSGHIDSTDVALELHVADQVESWVLDVAIAVPWPVLKVVRVDIEDVPPGGGSGDGVLDADESAVLEITIANSGDLPTADDVVGTLSVGSGSTATANILLAEDDFGVISAGAVRDDDGFSLELTSGVAGDTLNLVFSMTDGVSTWVDTIEFVLGEPPWISLSTLDDDQGDVVDDYSWDFINGRYRVVDGVVEMVLESATPYDAGSLFLEGWGQAPGSSYSYLRWVLQAGTTSMQGYTSGDGFATIGTMDVDFLSSTEVGLSWSIEDMDVATNSFSIGWAAGWCGPESYYCDHFPDGWGYPYVSFSTGDWFTVEW